MWEDKERNTKADNHIEKGEGEFFDITSHNNTVRLRFG